MCMLWFQFFLFENFQTNLIFIFLCLSFIIMKTKVKLV